MFLGKFEEFNKTVGRDKVKIEAKWLEIDDYPKMVGSCDLGVCMHMSSSNLDLPMKVVDMFSCRLPCFAYDYPTIGELVFSPSKSEKPNGALFKTAADLAGLLVGHLDSGLEAGMQKLARYRTHLEKFERESWEEHWQEVMLVQGLFAKYARK
jgi:beta-1,4-mannosyltransferase